MNQQRGLVSDLKAALSDRDLYKAILWTIVVISGLLVVGGVISLNTGETFVSGPKGDFNGTDLVVFLGSSFGCVVSLFLLGKHLKLVFHKLLVLLYYVFGALYGLSIVVCIFAFLAILGDSVNSFLMAPVGIKPGYEYTGWASPWWLYAVVAFGMWIMFKAFQAAQENTKPPPPPAITH